MSDLVKQQILPLRTAAEQFRLAGVESSVRTFNPGSRIYYIGRKGGLCAMHEQEWNDYQALCARWSSGPLDLDGAPGISMLEQTRDEDEFAAPPEGGTPNGLSREDLRRIHGALLVTLKEARDLVSSARGTLSVEDYEDALTGAFEKLSLSVGCLSAVVEKGVKA